MGTSFFWRLEQMQPELAAESLPAAAAEMAKNLPDGVDSVTLSSGGKSLTVRKNKDAEGDGKKPKRRGKDAQYVH